MFYAYVFKSLRVDSYYYKGHCKDLEERLKQQREFLKIHFEIQSSFSFFDQQNTFAKDMDQLNDAGYENFQKAICFPLPDFRLCLSFYFQCSYSISRQTYS